MKKNLACLLNGHEPSDDLGDNPEGTICKHCGISIICACSLGSADADADDCKWVEAGPNYK